MRPSVSLRQADTAVARPTVNTTGHHVETYPSIFHSLSLSVQRQYYHPVYLSVSSILTFAFRVLLKNYAGIYTIDGFADPTNMTYKVANANSLIKFIAHCLLTSVLLGPNVLTPLI